MQFPQNFLNVDSRKTWIDITNFFKCGKLNSEENFIFLPRKWTEELNARTFMMIASQGIISNNNICEVIFDRIGSF